MTHDDINAAIAYGRAVAKRYSGAYGGCMDVYVGQSGRAFTAFSMRAVAAACKRALRATRPDRAYPYAIPTRAASGED